MRVLVLGGTGSIGSPTVRRLIERGHDVWALARSDNSSSKLAGMGATPVAGNIASPERWIARLPLLDAVIHAACDFNSLKLRVAVLLLLQSFLKHSFVEIR